MGGLVAPDFYRRGNSFTTRKQPCYWASLFTAANATEQGRYLMALRPFTQEVVGASIRTSRDTAAWGVGYRAASIASAWR